MKFNKKKVGVSDYIFKEKLVSLRRVTKVTKGGRNFSFSAVVVVGNGEGVVGYGLGKANEVSLAIAKGANDAKKNLITVEIIRETIAHEVEGKFGGGIVKLIPAAPGTGIVAGGSVRAVFEAAGILNVLSKSIGSGNAFNNVKAVFCALLKLKNCNEVARLRGVSLDKVFHG